MEPQERKFLSTDICNNLLTQATKMQAPLQIPHLIELESSILIVNKNLPPKLTVFNLKFTLQKSGHQGLTSNFGAGLAQVHFYLLQLLSHVGAFIRNTNHCNRKIKSPKLIKFKHNKIRQNQKMSISIQEGAILIRILKMKNEKM